MKHQVLHDDIINAYLDGSLDVAASERLLNAMHTDPALRQRVCELQEAKAWVSIAFADAKPPARPATSQHRQSNNLGRAAAIMLVLTLGFFAGWLSHMGSNQELNGVLLSQVAASENRVLLHISEADQDKFAQVLDEAEHLLNEYRQQGIQVEVLANAEGLNLLRAGVSPYAERVAQLINKYPNIEFIACANSIQRAIERGEQVILLDSINTQPTAIDHAVQRLREGWTYIQI